MRPKVSFGIKRLKLTILCLIWGGPLMAKIIDGASGQNNIEVKLKHRRARCLLFYLQGDTSKLGQPNDQTPNKAVQDLIRRGVARYVFSVRFIKIH